MYRVTVRDRIMIAHSFRGERFGPGARLHGATYLVEASFARAELDAHGVVVDIGLAHQALAVVLSDLAYRNLDEVPGFAAVNTTTEYLAGEIWRRVARRIEAGELGVERVDRLEVTLRQSDVAWASYEAALR